MPQTRFYSSQRAQTTLTNAVTSAATSIVLDSTSGMPGSFPFTLILEPEGVRQEVVTVASGAGTVGTPYVVTRGVDGSTAQAHSAGVVVVHGVSARDFAEPNLLVGDANAAWTTYTPTWTSTGTAPSLGNGVLVGRHKKVGSRLDVVINLTIGSTTTAGTLLWMFGLPFTTAASGVEFKGSAWCVDSGTGYYVGVCHVAPSSALLAGYFAFAPNNASTFGANPLTATFPVTPATNDQFQFQITVEV